MARYFLDTHIVYWLISESPKLDNNLREDILYPSGDIYLTSEFVILELTHLCQLEKIKIPGGVKALQASLSSMNVELDLITDKAFEVLEKTPILTIDGKKHTDMIDRIIIANCIAYNETLISHDSKVPQYRKYGLKLLEA